MSSTLYRGGFVYTPGSPRATAMLVDDAAGVILWVGDEAAADRLGRPDRVTDLSGALAAPAFVDACTVPGAGRRVEAARAGTASVHVVAGPDGSAADGSPADGSAANGSADGSAADGPAADEGAAPAVGTVLYWQGPGDERPAGARPATSSTDPDEVAALVRTATDVRRQCSLWAGDDPGAVLRGVGSAARSLADGERAVASCAHRLVVDADLPGTVVADLARLGMVVVVIGGSTVDLRALAAAGVPFAFGSRRPVDGRPGGVTAGSDGSSDPWDVIRFASSPSAGAGAVSVRAAFAAATRGGHRAAGAVGGDLRPGTDATFAVWSFDGDLVVRTPDARVAAWSTDPRAATPGLPDLDRGNPRPLRLVVAGSVVDVTLR